MGESVACVMKEINQSRVLVRKSEGKRPHGRHRCSRWKIDIKTNVKKRNGISCAGFVWYMTWTSKGLS